MINRYLLTGDKKTCNGCGICALACPHNCISMKEDNEGFLYPIIDKSKCTHCDKCKKICSHFNDANPKKARTYAAINKNDEDRRKSSSGGMFILLAKYILNKKGVVFGVKLDENLVAVHDYAETLKDCEKFMGSKYVQSDIGGMYEKARQFLEHGRYVLFTGMPCQINALRVYLKKDYPRLVLCDVICASTPSPKVFRNYIKDLERIKGEKVVNVLFRSKIDEGRNQVPFMVYSSHTCEKENTYFRAFGSELISRPSCYSCPFVGLNRCSDFTIGDFWGFEKLTGKKEDHKGISLLNINTVKATKIFDAISKQMEFREFDTKLAFSYNHHCNMQMHPNRDKFFSNIDNEDITGWMNFCIEKSFLKQVLFWCKKYLKGRF